MEALGPGAVGEEFEAAGGGAEREPLRMNERGSAEAGELSGGDRAAEDAGDAGRMESDLVEPALGDHPDTGRHLDAGDEGREKIATRGAGFGADGKHGRQQARAHVHDAGDMRVVVVEAMDEDAVDQRRVAGAEPQAGADDGALPARRRERLTRRAGNPPIVLTRRGEGDAGRVQQQQLRALDRFGRDPRKDEILGETGDDLALAGGRDGAAFVGHAAPR